MGTLTARAVEINLLLIPGTFTSRTASAVWDALLHNLQLMRPSDTTRPGQGETSVWACRVTYWSLMFDKRNPLSISLQVSLTWLVKLQRAMCVREREETKKKETSFPVHPPHPVFLSLSHTRRSWCNSVSAWCPPHLKIFLLYLHSGSRSHPLPDRRATRS